MKEIRTLKASEIECRAQQVKQNGCIILVYKDARVDMKILDETFGNENWQRTHEVINGNLFCNVEVWDADKKCWVKKQDVGVESNTEAQKGEASDAFKRACFNVGIGRELYTAPFIWIALEQSEVYNKGDKWYLNSGVKFSVKDIEYNEDREISKLIIVDAKGKTRFEMGKFTQAPTKEKTTDFAKLDDAILQINNAANREELTRIWKANKEFQKMERFINAATQAGKKFKA